VIFEWDEEKRRENLRKHGFDFADCAQFFDGPIYTEPDERFAYGEVRIQAYGMLHERVVKVVYTEAAATIRLISVRKASRHEKARYFANLPD
jgi:uncharacterized DUF497 family protein